MLAAVGGGWHADVAEAAGAMVHIDQQVDPDKAQAERYDSLYPVYTSLYPQLKDAFTRLAEFNKTETGKL
jgi:sugar (pentulose or hexulose) kinase